MKMEIGGKIDQLDFISDLDLPLLERFPKHPKLVFN